MATILISFGYNKGVPEMAYPAYDPRALIIDVRPLFGRNPFHNKKLRYLRGTDLAVQQDIMKTPHFAVNYAALKDRVMTHPGPVYLGCTGGHHRSVYLAQRLSEELQIPVSHVHIAL